MRPPRALPWRRAAVLGWVLWTVAVLAAHWAALASLEPVPWGEAAAPRPQRIEVAFVSTLAPSPPPAAPGRSGPAPTRAGLRTLVVADWGGTPGAGADPPGAAASAAASASAASADPLSPPAVAPDWPRPDLPAPLAPVPSVAALAGPEAAAGPTVDWPPSTRLRYRVLGQFRGPAEGEAQVEWLRSGSRYQVHMTLAIGPGFAPLASRTVRSEGEIVGEGLAPRRYEEETRALFTEPRRLSIELGERDIALPGGQRVPRPAGVQDSASQFVQLTWMFTLDPSLLTPGRSLELPLALPRRVEPWVFDVIGPEILAMDAGTVEAVHVKPRREARPGGDLTAEVWIAPTLQYLPVRILIRQSAETWLDLTLQTWPEQAAPERR